MVLQVDGGPRAGFGHVGRCLALADEFGPDAAFAVEDEVIAGRLAALGIPVVRADADASVVLIDSVMPTDEARVRELQSSGRRVCLVDDPGSGRAAADLVVDPPTGTDWPPAAGRVLAGFDHVLLRREIRAAVPDPADRTDIVIMLGGSDPEGLTPALAAGLIASGRRVLSVLGPTYQGPRPDGEVLADPSRWPQTLAGATVLVTRFGHTLLEAASLGVPAVAIATTPEARREAIALANHGSCVAVPVTETRDVTQAVAAALDLLADAGRREAMAVRGRTLVDGLGAARVAAAIRELV